MSASPPSGRSSGILLHPTSLPGPHGNGDLGRGARRFVDLLAAAGQRWWQMLPIGPPGIGNSPYSALSAFAGNPLLIDLEALAADGLLGARELAPSRALPASRVDYPAATRWRLAQLRRAFEACERRPRSAARARLEAFSHAQRAWLDDHALFAALRGRHRGAAWTTWEPGLRARRAPDLARARRTLATEIRFQKFLQSEFDHQWSALRRHGARRGVALIGDLPFYVAHDSADVWAHPEVFLVDARGALPAVAGVPPDAFSRTGQLWGNPLYRWSALRRTGYRWWVARLRRTLARFDVVRLDHFIGFHRVWRVPGDAATAETGTWERTPGAELLRRLRPALGGLPFIAEDLGLVTREVHALRDRFGLPGTRVLQFAFDGGPDNPHLPHNHPRHCVVCTGTHDHDPVAGWFRRLAPDGPTRRAALRYLGTGSREIHWEMIRLAMQSVAATAILPWQDVLGLGSEARMNVPGVPDGNWEWRVTERQLGGRAVERLGELTETYGRRQPQPPSR